MAGHRTFRILTSSQQSGVYSKCKNNIKLIYLTFIHCTCKFEKHKPSFLSANCEQNFPNKNHKKNDIEEGEEMRSALVVKLELIHVYRTLGIHEYLPYDAHYFFMIPASL